MSEPVGDIRYHSLETKNPLAGRLLVRGPLYQINLVKTYIERLQNRKIVNKNPQEFSKALLVESNPWRNNDLWQHDDDQVDFPNQQAWLRFMSNDPELEQQFMVALKNLYQMRLTALEKGPSSNDDARFRNQINNFCQKFKIIYSTQMRLITAVRDPLVNDPVEMLDRYFVLVVALNHFFDVLLQTPISERKKLWIENALRVCLNAAGIDTIDAFVHYNIVRALYCRINGQSFINFRCLDRIDSLAFKASEQDPRLIEKTTWDTLVSEFAKTNDCQTLSKLGQDCAN